MQALILGLVLVAGLLTIQRMMLRGQTKIARLEKQAYQFHAIRDTLQLYAVEGSIDRSSETYCFIMWLTNFSIKNAGSMKFSSLVTTAAELEKTVERKITLFDDIKRHNDRIRDLAAESFMSFGHMLIINDPLVRVLARARRAAVHGGRLFTPIVTFSDKLAAGLAGRSTRAKAVTAARKYIGWGRDLATA
jgi:hypothetical protein